MDSSDKQENVEQLPGNESEEKGDKNEGSDHDVDLFTEETFENREGEKEETDADQEAPFPDVIDEQEDKQRDADPDIEEFIREVTEDPESEAMEAVEQAETTSSDDLQKKENHEIEGGAETDSPYGNGSVEGRGDEIKARSETDNLQVIEKAKRGKGGLTILIAVGLLLLLGIGFIHYKYDFLGINKEKSDLILESEILPAQKREMIKFDSFIVPFKENGRFTYLSLSFIFSLPNKEIRDEMSRKRDRIRGNLYEMFIEEVNSASRIPGIDHLKKSIITTVNRVVSAGVVEEVFVTQFLAV